MRALKGLGAALVAAIAGGVLAGGLARLFMRLANLAIGGETGFSWEGTFFIVMIFVIAMVPVALLAAFTARWWRWIPGVAGSGFLAVVAAGVASADLSAAHDLSAPQWVGASVATVAIFVAIAGGPVATVRVVDRLLARSPRRSPTVSLAT